MSRLLEILSRYAGTINAMEQAAFAHDFDKHDMQFLENPDWHAQKDKSYDDLKRIAERSERFRRMGLEDREIPNPGLVFSEIVQKEVSISSFGNYSSPFTEHHRRDEKIPFSLAGAIVHAGVCGADGIDSALDKNAKKEDKKQTFPFWIATPFEKKERQWDNSRFPAARDIWNCGGRIRECREALSDMLGETRPPFNDVTLYAHSYHVAAFAKAITAKILVEYHSGIRNPEDGKYHLPTRAGIEHPKQLSYLDCVKVEFDIDYLFSRSHTAGDLRGAVAELNSMMVEIRDFFESALLCGNELYHDHYRLLFVIPRLDKSLDGEWRQELRHALESQIVELLRKHHLEELPSLVSFNTQEMEEKYTLDKALIEFSRELLTNKHDFCRQNPGLLKSLEPRSDAAGRVCDVCGMRFASTSTGGNSDWLCPVCAERRRTGSLERSERRMPELEELVPDDENKLVYFSVQMNLDSLRDGSLWKEGGRRQLPSPGRIARSYETLENFHRDFLEKDLPSLAPEGSFSLLHSPERLDVIFAASAGDRVLSAFLEKYQEEFGSYTELKQDMGMHGGEKYRKEFKSYAEQLMPKIGMVYFHRKYPFYAVWDTMKRMMKQLQFGCWDFMLLDAPDDRFGFSPNLRKHHIFGKAPEKKLADFENYPRLFKQLAKLTKSQISNIENELVRLFRDWNENCRNDQETFRRMCGLSLFAPNAFGTAVPKEERKFLLDSAANDELLDVIDLFIHLENQKITK